MADAAIRAPRSLTEAQRLCERWSALDAEIAAIEEARDVAIAAANAEVDKDLLPLVAQRDSIAAKLGPWWGENAALLTQGKRKSAELGGCVLRTQAGRPFLCVPEDEGALIHAIRKLGLGIDLLRTVTALDKPMIARALLGDSAQELIALGFSLDKRTDSFSIKRTKQAGTQGKVQR